MVTKHANLIKTLPSPVYKIIAQSWYDKKFPRHIFIETTAACNLNCWYCPREKTTDHMDFEMFKTIIDEAACYGPRSFSLHLFGEPLLYPRFSDAVNYIKFKNRRNTILLTTNGTQIKKMADELARLPIDKIIWSYKKGQIIPKEIRSWKNLTIRFMEGEELPFPRREIRKLHNYGGTVAGSDLNVNFMAGKRYPCYHLWYAPAVAVDGKILICCSDPKRKSEIGNIKTMTLSQAWKKIEVHRLNHLNGNFEGICKNCDVWKQYPSTFFGWQYTT